MKWRKWVRLTHRDIGYLIAALTIIYAISGIAVNHVEDWNPNYIIEKKETAIQPVNDSTLSVEESISYILSKLNISDTIKNSFRPSPDEIDIFLEGKTISANLRTGRVIIETFTSRHLFRESNFLHLNNPKNLWTYIADTYAVSLALLAITGLFMIKGKKGIKGRGKWLVLFGLLIPLIFLIIYF